MAYIMNLVLAIDIGFYFQVVLANRIIIYKPPEVFKIFYYRATKRI
jgi:hypothetical protein